MDKKQWATVKKQFNDTSRYADIMEVPRHVSRAHLPMPQVDRAGQFAPFAALTGYKELLDKTAKRYQNKDYLSHEQLSKLVGQIKQLVKKRPWPTVTVTYFNGQTGYYENYRGQLVSVDWQQQRLRFRSGKSVVIRNLKRLREDTGEETASTARS